MGMSFSEQTLAQAQIPGEPLSTPHGSCLLLETEVPFCLSLPSRTQAQQHLAGALALLYGIGPVRESILRARGYTIFDLVNHPMVGRDAALWAEAITQRDLPRLYHGLCRWYSASHPLLLSLLGLAEAEELVFLDVESIGLSTLPVFLVGMGRIRLSTGRLVIRQFLAQNLSEEMAVLAQTLEELPQKPVVIGYNSKAHDWRQLHARLAYYGLGHLPVAAHLDLLFFARRLWAEALGQCSLSQVERRILGRTRPLDIPSELVPLYYEAFLRTRQPRYILPIVAHNREDVVSVAFLLKLVLEEHARNSFAA